MQRNREGWKLAAPGQPAEEGGTAEVQALPTPPAPKTLVPAWLPVAMALIAVVAMGFLASSVNQRRAESPGARVRFLQPPGPDPSDSRGWQMSFPRQYHAWESNRDPVGAPAFLNEYLRDYLTERPELVVLWAGFPFARAWNWPRGHAHAVEDVLATRRIDSRSPAACWACKGPDGPRLILRDGPEAFYARSFQDYRSEASTPVACLDCHDPRTMDLRVSRPALREAFQRQGRDLDQATHQELRSLVCAQCHAEYYFRGRKENYLTHPWDKGLTPEAFEDYYAGNGHVDWVHPISGAAMIKMQHPDYELNQQGPHARAGVACVDCHMPYVSEGSVRVTDHSMRSPTNNLMAACQVCHLWTREEMLSSIHRAQTSTRRVLRHAEKVLAAAHLEIGDAARLGATDAELAEVRSLISRAQMYCEYVGSANSMGFHAPEEAARVLGRSLDLAEECRRQTRAIRAGQGHPEPLPGPDLATRQKAWDLIQPYLEARKPQATEPDGTR